PSMSTSVAPARMKSSSSKLLCATATCCWTAWTSSSSLSASIAVSQPASRHTNCFLLVVILIRLPGGDADNEVDRWVEDLLDQRLVGSDTHLAAPVPVVPYLAVLVLMQVELRYGLLLFYQDDVHYLNLSVSVMHNVFP